MKLQIHIIIFFLFLLSSGLRLSASDVVKTGLGEDWQAYNVPASPATTATAEIPVKWYLNDAARFANSIDYEQTGSENKALRLFSSGYFINQQIGDSLHDSPYQVWEGKVKLPRDFTLSGASHQIYLFQYGQDLNATVNGANYIGITNNKDIFCGGQVYRVDNTSSKFVMRTETWYIFRRIMDFSVPGQNVSNLYIYEEDGTLVAQKTSVNVGNKPINSTIVDSNGNNILVRAIRTHFSGASVTSDPIMFDDFKFYGVSDASEPTPPDPEPAIAEGTFFALTWDPVYSKKGNFVHPYILRKSDLLKGIDAAAKKARFYTTGLPVGRRAILIAPWNNDLNDVLSSNTENYIWWDNGAIELEGLLDAFFEAYADLGGQLDYLIGDYEKSLKTWSLSALGGEPMPAKFNAIVNDPRYQTEIRPELVKMGFVFPTNAGLNEMYYVYTSWDNPPQDGTHLSMWKWNNLMEVRKDNYLNRAIFEPAKKYFPGVRYSNYGSSVKEEKYKVIDGNGTKHYLGGDNLSLAGTHSSIPMYGMLGTQLITTQPPEDYPGEFLATPFNSLLFDQQRYRPTVISTDGHRVMPWIAWRGKTTEGAEFGDTDYYNENILHTGLGNPDPFLYFNHSGAASYSEKDDTIFSNLMFELDELVGFEDRKSLIDSTMDWGAKYILTGMEAGGRNVWRITPDLSVPGVTVENFLHSDKNKYIKFKIGDQIVKFPEGSYIYKPEKENSSFGYWVISPINTWPKENIYDDDDDEICELEKVDKEKDHARKADWACKIYPNPANEIVTISVVPKNNMNAQNGELGNIRIQILNSFNSIVLIDDEMQVENTLTYSTSNLKEGVYIVKVTDREKVESLKLIVNHSK